VDITQKNNVRISGNKHADQTIVFGHGFGTDQISFAEVVKGFENDYRILLYDNVGGGKSDIDAFSTVRYSTLNGYVTDLLDICMEYQLENIIYVGHSVNGMVSLLSSIKAPRHFSKLVLLGASPRYLNDMPDYIGGFDQPSLDALYETMDSNYYAWVSGFSKLVMDNPDRPELAAQFSATLSAVRPDIALSVAKVIFQSDHRADLPKVNIPTLILQTAEDIAVPQDVAAYLHRSIAGSELKTIATKGHFPQISAPHLVIDAICSFISVTEPVLSACSN
jgi:sigma-B regulation protein RsbQ